MTRLLSASSDRPSRGQARRLGDLFRARLLAGEFCGPRLPDEPTLMREYGVGRNVVRSALRDLQDEGLIERRQGQGTFQTTAKAQHRLVRAKGFGTSIPNRHVRLTTAILEAQEISADVHVAAALEIETRTTCIAMDMLTSIDGHPAVFVTSYLADGDARERIRQLTEPGICSGDWYDVLDAADLTPSRRELAFEAVAASSMVAPILELDVGAPVMRFQRRLVLGERAVPEYGFSYIRGDMATMIVGDNA